MYCKVNFRQAAKDAWSMMKGSRAVVYCSMVISALVVGVFGLMAIILDAHSGAALAPMSAGHWTGAQMLQGAVMFVLFSYIILVVNYVLSTRLFVNKVPVRQFFQGFARFGRILPAFLIMLIWAVLYGLFFLLLPYYGSYSLILLIVLLPAWVFLGLASVLFVIYAGTTASSNKEIIDVLFRKQGSFRSLLSLFWCKIKLFFSILLLELAVAVVIGIVAGVGLLIVHVFNLEASFGLHLVQIILYLSLMVVLIFALFYWFFPFLSLFVVASFGQVVKENIKQYNLPLNPEFQESYEK